MIWLSAVSYATTEALTNCGACALESRVQTFFALAGSWMSRTTIVGSPTTVPITRLSPAGTVAEQWTRVAGPGAPLGIGEAGAVDGELAGEPETVGEAELCDAVLVGLPPQAAMNTRTTAAAAFTRTA